jgi:hypothetical protein
MAALKAKRRVFRGASRKLAFEEPDFESFLEFQVPQEATGQSRKMLCREFE